MIETIIGKEALPAGVIYDQLGSFLILATYGSFILAYYSGKEISTNTILSKIATFPPFIFLLIALFFGKAPAQAEHYLNILSTTLTPLAIISVGFGITLKFGDHKKILVFVLTTKLLIVPILLLMIFKVLGLNTLESKVTILESAMPSMITAGALAINAGFAPKLAAEIVGYGLIVSLVTIPIIAKLM